MAYTEVSVIGYNANPPPDDGSQTSENEITWGGIKTKLTDPLLTALQAIDDNVSSFSDESPSGQSGTQMLFHQDSAPTGWTKETDPDLDDRALRLVTTSTASGSEGSISFSDWRNRTEVGGHTLTTSQIPSHDHGNGSLGGSTNNTNLGQLVDDDDTGNLTDGSGGVSIVEDVGYTSTTHDHSFTVGGTTANTGSGNSHTHGLEMRVGYRDVIIATKD